MLWKRQDEILSVASQIIDQVEKYFHQSFINIPIRYFLSCVAVSGFLNQFVQESYYFVSIHNKISLKEQNISILQSLKNTWEVSSVILEANIQD